jgi:hypothetical protein
MFGMFLIIILVMVNITGLNGIADHIRAVTVDGELVVEQMEAPWAVVAIIPMM